MPALLSKLKSQLECNRSTTTNEKIKIDRNDINIRRILRSDLIDTEVYDIYKSIPLYSQNFYEDMDALFVIQKQDSKLENWQTTRLNSGNTAYQSQ